MQQNPDMAKLMKMAQSPAGQELLSRLQHTGGQHLQDVMSKASAGDYEEAKQALFALMQDPTMQQLLRKMGEQP